MLTALLYFLMKIILIAFLIVVICSFRICIISEGKQNSNYSSDSTVTVTLSAVGDIMCHSGQFDYARVAKDSFDFNPVFRYVKQHLSKSDFTFGNLETVFAGKSAKYTGYPRFNSPSELLDALKNAGFDLLTTSNNHSLDRDEVGILRTINELNKRSLDYNGTYVSQRDRDSIRIYDIKGIRIAFLAYSYGTNGNPIPKGKSYLINLIDFKLIRKDIETAKFKNADIVLVHYHFGDEYKREPNQFQKVVVDSTIKMGANIIIGGHPHVLQPVRFVKSEKSVFDSVFVAYSLGNFISNQQWRYSDAGGILTLSISKNLYDNSIEISDVEFIPTYVFKGKIGEKYEYVILPSYVASRDTSFSFLKTKQIEDINQSINDTREVILKYSDKIVLK